MATGAAHMCYTRLACCVAWLGGPLLSFRVFCGQVFCTRAASRALHVVNLDPCDLAGKGLAMLWLHAVNTCTQKRSHCEDAHMRVHTLADMLSSLCAVGSLCQGRMLQLQVATAQDCYPLHSLGHCQAPD